MKIHWGLTICLLWFPFGEFVYANESPDDETQIRAARQASNEALRKQDADAMVAIYAPEYHIITGSSRQSHGVEAERKGLAELFAADPEFYCQRDIRELRINGDWGLAEELGDWNCFYSAQGQPTHASGVYAAKWQRAEGGEWLIQSEVFTTLECKGDSGCKGPASIESKVRSR